MVGGTPLSTSARSIFESLGYTVSGRGTEFRAERAWKEVRVTTVPDPDAVDVDGRCRGLRCYVTDSDRAEDLRRRLDRADPDCAWAVIGVRDGREDYEVVRAPPVGS